MERLTQRTNGVVVYVGAHNEEVGGQTAFEVGWRGVREILARLAAYEDTGLTPENCAEYRKFEDEIIASGKTFGRLIELLKADKDGRVVVLPCKVGDTVYEVTSRKTISEYRVKAIRVELFCTFIEWDIAKGFVDKSLWGVTADEIGKTVFLTREEAEAALKGE